MSGPPNYVAFKLVGNKVNKIMLSTTSLSLGCPIFVHNLLSMTEMQAPVSRRNFLVNPSTCRSTKQGFTVLLIEIIRRCLRLFRDTEARRPVLLSSLYKQSF
ncbi:hypothetical protein L596_017934 [Steinernema carpocapsae]|uniref:Uncharacterized protein n=1 Tax=Steinernema carpocapsae TaxID=34508 RepID=A0A4U5N354_STECR|nr:hypothetical protein L596_017934 [Steinernema carpocapsae]